MEEGVLSFTDENFEKDVLKADIPVLVDFWAEWCIPCKMIAQAVENISKSYRHKAKVGRLNVDENPAATYKYNIKGIPTLLLFVNGKVKDQIVGAVSQEVITQMIEQNTKK
ncbi:MAG: thioredoxin [Candidatus Aminicenantes bacterium]|nr:thioredoxin [Candidatus Aminicenantes bacterium]MDH5714165.1 thioredoxin [Candidatus Aminicenantes bacterium]